MPLEKQADENKGMATANYDFARCKLCGATAAVREGLEAAVKVVEGENSDFFHALNLHLSP